MIAIQAALLARDKAGEGQHIDMALFDTQVGVLANQASTYLMTGNVPQRMGNAHPSIVPYQVFQASDAPFVIACGNDGQFVQLSKALGQDYHNDPRFVTNKDRLDHRVELAGLMQTLLDDFSRDKVLDLMESAGVPAGPINTIAEAFDDPQILHRGMKTPQGRLRNPVRFSNLELAADTPSPELNEHGKNIRKNLWNTDN